MDRENLLDYARDALKKLDQPALLQIHPLTALLFPGGQPRDRSTALRTALVEAMQQLRPPHSTDYDSPAWRRYRSMVLFYLEGKRPDDVAHLQGVGERQTRRDLHQAVDELGELLWARYCQIHDVTLSPVPTDRRDRSEIVDAGDTLWEAEVDRIGSLPPEDAIALDAALRDAVSTVDKLAGRLGTRITITMGQTLPPVTINRSALRLALLNVLGWILDNGSGGELTISVGEVARGVGISIPATGWKPGPESTFDDGSSLRLVQRLLERQGGAMEIRSASDGTSRLLLILPSVSVPTILIVDDNPEVLPLFRRYLHPSTVRLVQATTAEQALQSILELRPQLVTLDLMMPVRDGWDLLQAVRRDPAICQIPIAVCSIVHERTLAMELGATYFLPKPVTRAILLQLLDQCGLGPMNHLENRAQTSK